MSRSAFQKVTSSRSMETAGHSLPSQSPAGEGRKLAPTWVARSAKIDLGWAFWRWIETLPGSSVTGRVAGAVVGAARAGAAMDKATRIRSARINILIDIIACANQSPAPAEI